MTRLHQGQTLQGTYAESCDGTHESEIAPIDPIVDQRRTDSQANGQAHTRRRNPEPRNPAAKRIPFDGPDNDPRDKTFGNGSPR